MLGFYRPTKHVATKFIDLCLAFTGLLICGYLAPLIGDRALFGVCGAVYGLAAVQLVACTDGRSSATSTD